MTTTAGVPSGLTTTRAPFIEQARAHGEIYIRQPYELYDDGNQDTWAPDQAYSAGSWGYTVRGNEASTRSAIGGTADGPLYQTARRGQTEYKFDGLPTGVYQVELRFAEIQNYGPNRRLFDVTIEGTSTES